MAGSKKTMSRWKVSLIVAVCLVFIGILAGTYYVNDYYHAGNAAIATMESDSAVSVTVWDDGTVIFAPRQEAGADKVSPIGNSDSADTASVSGGSTEQRSLIFYPGGKVEYTAYAPLLHDLAARGWHCALVKMPFNLAVFDMNAADGITDQFPEVESWYIGGHSLGGAMAASYVAKHVDDFDGLILLAAYSTEDLTESGLNVYSIYGSEDMVLNHEKYAEYRLNLPSDVHELVIEGGCHAWFGDYGTQDGDGTPTITAEEQRNITIEFINQ